MTQSECEKQEYPHSARGYMTHGFLCEDCGKFFTKDSPTHIRYALPGNLWMVIHNIGVEFVRAGKGEPETIKRLCAKLDGVPQEENQAIREAVLNESLRFIAVFHKTPDSAMVPLKCA